MAIFCRLQVRRCTWNFKLANYKLAYDSKNECTDFVGNPSRDAEKDIVI